jgi:hypothetical protein
VFSPSAESGQVTHEFQLARGEVLYIELRSQGEVALPISPLRQELADWYEARRGTKK